MPQDRVNGCTGCRCFDDHALTAFVATDEVELVDQCRGPSFGVRITFHEEVLDLYGATQEKTFDDTVSGQRDDSPPDGGSKQPVTVKLHVGDGRDPDVCLDRARPKVRDQRVASEKLVA